VVTPPFGSRPRGLLGAGSPAGSAGFRGLPLFGSCCAAGAWRNAVQSTPMACASGTAFD